MTTKWIECITAIGLFLMPPEAQRDRMNRVFAGDTEIKLSFPAHGHYLIPKPLISKAL